MYKKTKFIVQSGIIAALYAALTLALAPISYGEVQVRISEALTILPYFTPAAIPGLFIGCFTANMIGPNGIWDVIIGSGASLIAAVFSYLLRRYKFLVPLPPIIVNGVIIGTMLSVLYGLPLVMAMISVTIGQIVACYGLGLPLLLLLDRYKTKIFR